MLGRRRLGHRALLHRLRAARQRRDVGDVRGRARLPGQGHLVGAVRALRRDDLLHGADRDPRLHEVGRRVPGAPRPLHAAAARHGRRADQPEGVALVPQGDRRRALPDRRHVVADRDRRDHDHDAARACIDTKPGSAGKPLPGIEAGVVDDERRGRRHRAGLPHAARPWPGMLRTLYKEEDRFIETYWSKFGNETLHRRRRGAGATRTATSGSSGASTTCSTSPATGMSTAEIESAIVSLLAASPRRR